MECKCVGRLCAASKPHSGEVEQFIGCEEARSLGCEEVAPQSVVVGFCGLPPDARRGDYVYAFYNFPAVPPLRLIVREGGLEYRFPRITDFGSPTYVLLLRIARLQGYYTVIPRSAFEALFVVEEWPRAIGQALSGIYRGAGVTYCEVDVGEQVEKAKKLGVGTVETRIADFIYGDDYLELKLYREERGGRPICPHNVLARRELGLSGDT